MCEGLQTPSADPAECVRQCVRDVSADVSTTVFDVSGHIGGHIRGHIGGWPLTEDCGFAGNRLSGCRPPRFGEPGHIGPMRVRSARLFHAPLTLDRSAEALSPRG